MMQTSDRGHWWMASVSLDQTKLTCHGDSMNMTVWKPMRMNYTCHKVTLPGKQSMHSSAQN